MLPGPRALGCVLPTATHLSRRSTLPPSIAPATAPSTCSSPDRRQPRGDQAPARAKLPSHRTPSDTIGRHRTAIGRHQSPAAGRTPSDAIGRHRTPSDASGRQRTPADAIRAWRRAGPPCQRWLARLRRRGHLPSASTPVLLPGLAAIRLVHLSARLTQSR